MADHYWRGCVVPDHLQYDVGMNVWVRPEAETVVLGMTDIAQTLGGRLVQVSWKRPNRQYLRGRPLAVIESAKWVGPFPTPLTGELVEVNDSGFAADITIANRDPYGRGWLARIRPTAWAEEQGALLDGAAAVEHFRRLIDEQDIRCYRCAD